MSAGLSTTQDRWSVGLLLNWTDRFFRGKGLDEPRLSAEILLANALGCERINLYTRFDDVPRDEERASFREGVQRAGRHTPIAYLVGHKEFFSLKFNVTPDVLIPRPETETLVEHAVEWCKRTGLTGASRDTSLQILDLGTGSGCIIISVLTQVTHTRGTATDISAAALKVARRNAEFHKVSDRLTLVEADRLKLPSDVIPEGGFDLLVCNPPYIAEADMHSLAVGVRDHEPTIALTPGGDGLGFFRAIASGAPTILQPKADLMVEIGAGQSEPVKAIFTSEHHFAHMGTYRSGPDPHDRVMYFAKL